MTNRPKAPLPANSLNTATESVSARLFDHLFTLPSIPRFRSSFPTLPPFRDGTDPRLAGLRARRWIRLLAGGRPGDVA
jgi:hypothetical protein